MPAAAPARPPTSSRPWRPGPTGLLLDEDTSATNFMLRDARMQQLVHREHEPITPFVDRVRELYESIRRVDRYW